MVFLLFILKPKFVIGTGVGWSATTPFWYTLQVDNKFIHAGLIKESQYLYNVSDTKENILRKKIVQRRLYKNHNIPTLKNPLNGFKFTNNKFNHFFKNRIPEVKRDMYLTQEEIDNYITAPYTFVRYINYYKRLWETLQENNCPYEGVADFSNANGWIPEESLPKTIEKLSEYFDVKALIIVRDPIRRLWSEVGGFWDLKYKYDKQGNLKAEESLPNIELYKNLLFEYVRGYNQSQYFSIIDKWEKVCPFHVIIMEQLWEGDEQEREKQRLSDFLDYDIKNTHENVYCPDRGTNAPKHLGLKDQWSSDKYSLSDELYNQVLPLMPIYQQWVDRYGSLPLYWGKPYNYEV